MQMESLFQMFTLDSDGVDSLVDTDRRQSVFQVILSVTNNLHHTTAAGFDQLFAKLDQ